ncbi:MAG: hypothetical protein IPN01_35165 [Deltaproteobacteria bacterium]|nr:hypothetical protein [Deltaproteobacteria bacterium]
MLPLALLTTFLAAPPSKTVSLELVDAPITHALTLIAEVGDLQLVMGDDVKGTVTVSLVDVAWEDAFNAVLLTHGLVAVPVGELTVVKPAS